MHPNLSHHISRKLPPALETLLNDASREPNDCFRFLLTVLLPKFPSWLDHPRILDLYVRQFDQPPPSDVVLSPNVEAAVHAFMGLSLAISCNIQGCHLLRDTILSKWTDIWPWMHFLYHNHPVLTNEPSTSAFLCESLQQLLIILVQDPCCTAVVSTEGVLELAFAMWIRLGGQLTNSADARLSLVTMSEGLSSLVKSPLTDIKELHVAVGFNRRQAAENLFKPMQMSIHGGPAWTRCLCLILDIHRTICMRTPDFYGSLPTNTIISNICDALSTATAILESQTNETVPAKILIGISLALLIIYSRKAAESYSWVIHALRHDFLSLLYDCCLHVQIDDIYSCIDAMINEIKIYAIYRPVLRYLKKAAVVDRTLEGIQDEKIRSQWISLRQAISCVYNDEVEFNKLGEYSPPCSYDQCEPEDEVATKVRRCLGCKSAWYCSTACQRLDWTKHRNVCGSFRPSRNAIDHPRTQKFFRYLVELQMVYQKTTIVDNLHRFRLRDPTPQLLILLFDYSSGIPPELSVRPLGDFEQFTFPDIPWKPALLPCIRVQYGARHRELLFCSYFYGELFGWLEQPDTDDNTDD